jgi:hypothetical protein
MPGLTQSKPRTLWGGDSRSGKSSSHHRSEEKSKAREEEESRKSTRQSALSSTLWML